jgi:alpha-methylacyl-CoA racemase
MMSPEMNAGEQPPAGGFSAGPLSGIRVLEIGGLGPAPFAGMLLADLGAEVARVDRPEAVGHDLTDGSQVLQRGKRSAALDLKHPDGVAAVLAMSHHADVLIESFRPGVAERIGIGPAATRELNPRLVYARVTGWGQSGPRAAQAGHDVGYLARTGLLHAIGAPEAPSIPLALVGDFAGGALYLVIGILAAVREAGVSGRGQVIDSAIVDGAAHLGTMVFGMLAAGTWQDRREANLIDGASPFYAVYATSDGRHLAVGPIERPFYASFLHGLGLDSGDLPKRGDQSQWPLLRERFAKVIATRTQAQWLDIFAGTDACVEPVLSLTEALTDEHLTARETFVEVGGVTQPAPAPRFSRTPGRIASRPGLAGEHTRDVLLDWGIDPEPLLASTAAVQRPPS